MADLKITELPALPGASIAADDVAPVADISASETKKITIGDFFTEGISRLVSDASIPGSKIETSSLTSTQLAANSVGATQLAANSVDTAALQTDSVSGAAGAKATIIAGSIGTADLATGAITSSKIGSSAVGTTALQDASVTNSKLAGSIDTSKLVNATTANQVLAGPTTGAGAISARTLQGSDIPTPTSTTKGAVIINAQGLRLNGDTLEINNDVTASATHYVVTYDAKGLVTGGRALIGSDLPIASDGVTGSVSPGTGLSVSGSGVLNHSNSITPGTATKVTYDAQGHISLGESITETDVPDLSASKITSGTLSTSLIGTNSLAGSKFADSSTTKFGGAGSTGGIVTFPIADYKGQYFYDELHEDLYLWNGNAWIPITITAGELTYAGTYDASTNTVASVTAAGAAAGLVPTAALPAASDDNLRYYVVVSQSGTGSSPAPVVALAPPDMLVSGGTSWELIDVSNAIAGQTASNISFTPYGGIAATNVQTALQELDDEKLAASGGDVTGTLSITATGNLVFEGSTADDYETSLSVVDPTADRTILLPNVSGTVITTGDTGTVTNTMLAGSIADSKLAQITTADKVSIAAIDINGATDIGAAIADADLLIIDDGGGGTNRKTAVTRVPDYTFSKVSGDITIAAGGTAAISSGVIVDADISASAAITPSKVLYGTARQLLQTNAGGTATEWTSNIDIPGTLDVTSTVTFDAGGLVQQGWTVNESGGAYDFRVEGDTQTHLLYVQGSTDRVGINQSSPASKLDVSGNYACNITAMGALDVNCSSGNYFTKTINGNSTFTVSSVPASRAYAFTLELTHTSGTVTWFSGVQWPGNTAPTLTTGKVHLFTFITDDGGTSWRGSSQINYAS